jgi:hypothetical protein
MRTSNSEKWSVDPCDVCCMKDQRTFTSGVGNLNYDCERCGTYELIGGSTSIVRKLKPNQRTLLSGWIRSQNESGINFVKLKPDILANVLSYGLPSYQTRFEALIRYLMSRCPELGRPIRPDAPEMTAISYSANDGELDFILKHMLDEGYIDSSQEGLQIKPAAYERYQSSLTNNQLSSQVFVAMSFAPDFDDLYIQGIEPAIIRSGMRSLRVDKTEHTNRIDDEILRQISASQMVVAEFTNQVPGVYFEAGYALAQGKKVIWVCKKEQMDKLHFDIRQYNCIFWETPQELSSKLENRILANK